MTNQYLEEKVFELEKRVEKIELSKIISDLPSINEPCDDAISRDAALICLTGEFEPDKEYKPEELIELFSKRIKQLPPVNPQPSEHFIDGVHAVGYREGYKDVQKQKSGKWLITPMSNIAHCSECDYLFKDIPASIVEHFKHCPNCGYRIESEAE